MVSAKWRPFSLGLNILTHKSLKTEIRHGQLCRQQRHQEVAMTKTYSSIHYSDVIMKAMVS